jgi:hypothetical protein
MRQSSTPANEDYPAAYDGECGRAYPPHRIVTFRYFGAPVISGLSPSFGDITGSTFTINGAGFSFNSGNFAGPVVVTGQQRDVVLVDVLDRLLARRTGPEAVGRTHGSADDQMIK